MALEIEHKYLVVNDSYLAMATSHTHIEQGYLCDDPCHTLRVRIADDKAYLTIKGLNYGATRNEWEYQIPTHDAQQMMQLCKTRLSKTRYNVPYEGRLWEVDVFHDRLEGLVLAEIELPSEDSTYAVPPFAGINVTGEEKYYNSNLSKQNPLS